MKSLLASFREALQAKSGGFRAEDVIFRASGPCRIPSEMGFRGGSWQLLDNQSDNNSGMGISNAKNRFPQDHAGDNSGGLTAEQLVLGVAKLQGLIRHDPGTRCSSSVKFKISLGPLFVRCPQEI